MRLNPIPASKENSWICGVACSPTYVYHHAGVFLLARFHGSSVKSSLAAAPFFCRSCRSGCQNWTIVFDTWLMYQGLSTGSAQESVSHSCQGTFKVAAISAPAWESHSSLTPRIAKVGASLISSLGSGSTFAVSAKSSLHCEPAEFAVAR